MRMGTRSVFGLGLDSSVIRWLWWEFQRISFKQKFKCFRGTDMPLAYHFLAYSYYKHIRQRQRNHKTERELRDRGGAGRERGSASFKLFHKLFRWRRKAPLKFHDPNFFGSNCNIWKKLQLGCNMSGGGAQRGRERRRLGDGVRRLLLG